jgi:DNA-binding response OmpR family regulator
MRICIVEDEQAIAVPLKRSLEKEGFAVDIAADGNAGLRLIQVNTYDCILLDLHLPVLDGLEVIRRLRNAENTTPVIMLTAKSQVYDKVEGFAYGADDYITKPFHLDELVARIRAVIKRSSENTKSRLYLGDYLFEPKNNRLVREKGKKHTIDLTTKETAILEYLLRNPNQIISTEEILEHVWDSEVDLFTDTVKTHIKTLRQKIDPEKRYLVTIRGKGYSIRQL